MAIDIIQLLQGNPYPGRGILLGRSEDGTRDVIVYFIMGRSENSRNRVFERTADGIRTAAFDPGKLADPSLVIYRPIRKLGEITIVTNGDQTDTIFDYISSGRPYSDALQTRTFEPDPPNYTPRISGIVMGDGSFKMSILKSLNGDPAYCIRNFFEYSAATPGFGRFISTYITDGAPLPSFEGEPILVSLDVSNGLERFTEEIWNIMDPQNKVSIFARETLVSSGVSTDYIINKHRKPG